MIKKLLAIVLGLVSFGWGQSTVHTATREGNNPFSGNNTFSGFNQFTIGIEVGPIAFSALGGISTSTTLIYLSDGTFGSSPCTGGGTGALAIRINGAWNCNGGSGGGGTPSAPVSSVQFNNAGAFGGSSNLTWNSSGNILNLNQSTGGFPVQIGQIASGTDWNSNTGYTSMLLGSATTRAAPGPTYGAVEIHSTWAGGGVMLWEHNNTPFLSSELAFLKSEGTQSSPVTVAGDYLGEITFNGFDGTNYAGSTGTFPYNRPVAIASQADGNVGAWTTSNHVANIQFIATVSGITPTEVFRMGVNTNNGSALPQNFSDLNMSTLFGTVLGFSQGSTYPPDTGISRLASDSFAFGNGTAGDTSGTLKLASAQFISGVAGLVAIGQGTAPSTIANTVGHTAPTAVTAYNMMDASAAGNGVTFWSSTTNSPGCVASATNLCASFVNPMLIPTGSPTIASGFGTGAAIVPASGAAFTAFQINVGTGASASTGSIGLPTAAHGWNCWANDLTTFTSLIYTTRQTADSTTSSTIGNYSSGSPSPGAWNASDILEVSCFPR
jgi:hypothetical protein